MIRSTALYCRRDTATLRDWAPNGIVLTIGNFDGVHLGHQALIKRTVELAHTHRVPAVLMTFEPQPNEYFRRQAKCLSASQKVGYERYRMMGWSDKYRALCHTGLDAMLCLRFDARLAQLSAEAFVTDILVQQLGVRAVVVGDDFRFGAGRRGDYALLKRLGQQYGFQAIDMPTLSYEGRRISSSWLRSLILEADFTRAEQLLGRSVAIRGRVVQGDQRGRLLGFPTANLHDRGLILPPPGIYVVTATVDTATSQTEAQRVLSGMTKLGVSGMMDWPAVASVGTRPTFHGQELRCEVHLLDYSGDLYGQPLITHFYHRLRPERYYETVDALVQQMHQDVAQTRCYFEGRILTGASVSKGE